MNKQMEQALLDIYPSIKDAAVRQIGRGISDQGNRRGITSGKHMDGVIEVIKKDLISNGYDEKGLCSDIRNITLPGWYRVAKSWDLLAFDNNDLLAAIELKSMGSSFGNNLNNRVEEVIGCAVDAAKSIKEGLIPYRVFPPVLGYAIFVRLDSRSMKITSVPKTVCPTDPVFDETSYFDRLVILCNRMLSERLYQAVWIAGVKEDEIVEPSSDLSYNKFIAALSSAIQIYRA